MDFLQQAICTMRVGFRFLWMSFLAKFLLGEQGNVFGNPNTLHTAIRCTQF